MVRGGHYGCAVSGEIGAPGRRGVEFTHSRLRQYERNYCICGSSSFECAWVGSAPPLRPERGSSRRGVQAECDADCINDRLFYVSLIAGGSICIGFFILGELYAWYSHTQGQRGPRPRPHRAQARRPTLQRPRPILLVRGVKMHLAGCVRGRRQRACTLPAHPLFSIATLQFIKPYGMFYLTLFLGLFDWMSDVIFIAVDLTDDRLESTDLLTSDELLAVPPLPTPTQSVPHRN